MYLVELQRVEHIPTKEHGIFDGFEAESGREAHLNGRIAAALMAKAGELLAEPPKIEKVDLLAVKP